jgi:ACS family glucarate transporter-like MFS transporter
VKVTPIRAGSVSVIESRKASGVRWRILTLIFLVSMVTYLDRVNISIAAKQMMDSYRLSSLEMGKVFSAFILAYALFQVSGGWLADRFGPRIVLVSAIAWWSAFTALTACVVRVPPFSLLPAIWALLIVRFCLGMGEAATWPNFNRTNANWMAQSDRAFASSVPLAGGGLGAALTPPFILAHRAVRLATLILSFFRDRPARRGIVVLVCA